MCGGDFDQVITNSVRGFAGAALIVGIRHQPPLGMLRLLDHKVRTFDSSYIAKRVELARALAEVLSPAVELPGGASRRCAVIPGAYLTSARAQWIARRTTFGCFPSLLRIRRRWWPYCATMASMRRKVSLF